MTIQVGMLAENGLVLASDTQWTREPTEFALRNFPGNSQPVRDAYGSAKIRLDDTKRIAVTCARDMVAARQVADDLMSGLKDKNPEYRERYIREIGCDSMSRLRRELDIECIVAFADPIPSLYLFQHVKKGSEIISTQIITFVHVGDSTTPAVFWSWRYYKLLPVNKLKRLAAHLVVSAGYLNSGGVKGLEVVTCSSGESFHALSLEDNRKLELQTHEWDKRIGELILGDTQ